MCQVFRAKRPDLAMECALKVLRADALRDERAKDLFLTEADLSLLLRHPNLIRSYDAGEVEGRFYIVMEFLRGGTLAGLLKVLKRSESALPLDLSLYIVAEMLSGLHALHEAKGETGRPLGIVHRDVTPQNVLFDQGGRVVLGDFGVVHIEAHGSSDEIEIPGKVPYLAPESLSSESIDRRADVFSAGVVLYELLLGRLPFDGEDETHTLDLIADAKMTRPTRIEPDFDPALEEVLLAAMAKKPKDRPQSALALRDALLPFMDEQLANDQILAALTKSVQREMPNQS